MTDPPQAITDTIDVIVAKIRARVDQEIAEAVSAERETCAQLADQHAATYPVTCTMADCPCPPGESAHTRPFADLLRKDPR